MTQLNWRSQANKAVGNGSDYRWRVRQSPLLAFWGECNGPQRGPYGGEVRTVPDGLRYEAQQRWIIEATPIYVDPNYIVAVWSV